MKSELERNLEFYKWFKKLKLTDKEINERKELLNLSDEESRLRHFNRKLKWK